MLTQSTTASCIRAMSASLCAGVAVTLARSAAATPFEAPAVTRAGRTLMEITWDELGFPTGDEKHLAQASDSAVVDGVQYDTKYEVLLRSGDVVGGNTFGQLVDREGNGLTLDGEKYVSNGNDFTSLIPKGDYIYTVTHFESPEPAASYFTKSSQDPDTGKLTVESTEAMDWSAYGGLWTPCAGSVTPWQTHFGSEEYEPDARAWYDGWAANKTGEEWKEVVGEFWALYFGLEPASATNDDMYSVMYPYHYGYPWEVVVSDDGEIAKQEKIMAAGRLAIELPYVMPDNQTVYITDDGDNTMLGVYKLSVPGELECGAVWGAKFIQKSGEGGGEFDVEWIQVGEEACSPEFYEMSTKLTFYDMFEAVDVNEDGSCKDGYTSINTQPGGHECLKVIEGMEKWASRFEFRRMAAMMGVTTEFAKWEGITLDTKRNKIFTAISEVREGMEDFAVKGEPSDEFDLGGANDIKLEWNPCGCVYSMDLDDSYMATNMIAFICGDTDSNTDANNTCNKENIASPDNVAYVAGHDGLIIGEDTDLHQNDVLWYYDWASSSLTRFLSTPYGSETTSPYFYPNINGWAYITAVVQHPYGESDEEQIESPKATGVESYAGYIGPFKAHPGSVDMVPGVPVGGKLWNDFPASGTDMAGGDMPAPTPEGPSGGEEPMCMCPCSSPGAYGMYGA